ncbi:MAG: ankyrin repeat domain-containing protein [Sphingobacteriaceae bacterium]
MIADQLEAFIESGDITALAELLTRHPELAKSRTSLKVSPLMLSCYYKKPAITSMLINHLEEITLNEASAAGKFDLVAHILHQFPASVNVFSEDGFTPLGLACYFGHFEVTRYLILKGADVNLPSQNGFNVHPIHSATAGNFTDITRVLIESGAKINVVQQSGATPLHAAAQNGNIELLILLLDKGANVSIRMEGGKLPADLAREKGFSEIAEILAS